MQDFSFNYSGLDETPVSQLSSPQGGLNLQAQPVNAQKMVYINDYSGSPDKKYIRVLFILSGSGKMVIDGTERQIKQGMISILDGDTAYKVLPHSPVIIYSCSFMPELFGFRNNASASIGDISADRSLSYFFDNTEFDRTWSRVPKINLDAVQRIFNDMVSETEAQSPAYRQIMRLKISELLIRLSEVTSSESDNPEMRDVQLVNQIIAYIKNNYQKKLTYDDLAKMICVSRSKLFAVFKQVTGKTIGKYIEMVRIDRACIMLATTNDTVFKIMLDVGYKDMKMFCRRFKEFTQSTPTDYRKQHNSPL